MRTFLKILIVIVPLAIIAALVYGLFFVQAPSAAHITWGANFSQTQAEVLGLDWRQAYVAILDDLGANKIKLLTRWDLVAKAKGAYDFTDLDWQIQQAQVRNGQVIYVVGMKTGRWPECHVPSWAQNLSKEEHQAELTDYITATINRYKNSKAIVAWQVENEPFFRYGKCPWYDKKFVQDQVVLVKSIDSTRPVIISDSGEQSLWWQAARTGDIVGVTTYRRVWVQTTDKIGFYMDFPVRPAWYWQRAKIVEHLFNKKVIGVELQAEPWANKLFHEVSVQEQEKSMDIHRFRANVTYAKKTGLDTFYFWGAEWWYWLKETQNKPEIWNEAKNLFNGD